MLVTLETVEVLPQVKVLMRLDSSETGHVTQATTSGEVQSVWKCGRVTPCAGFGSEFTLETENVTPDTVLEGSHQGDFGHVTQVQVFQRGHPGACGHGTSGEGSGMWGHWRL